jgi:hypothetical protein
MSNDTPEVQFEDGVTVFHPAYAFRSVSANIVSDKALIAAMVTMTCSLIFGLPMIYTLISVGGATVLHLFRDKSEPANTDLLKIELSINNIINKKIGCSYTDTSKRLLLKSGNISCEYNRYRP